MCTIHIYFFLLQFVSLDLYRISNLMKPDIPGAQTLLTSHFFIFNDAHG